MPAQAAAKPKPRETAKRRPKAAGTKAPGRRPKAAAPAGAGLDPVWRRVADYLLGVLMLGAGAWALMAFLGVSPFR